MSTTAVESDSVSAATNDEVDSAVEVEQRLSGLDLSQEQHQGEQKSHGTVTSACRNSEDVLAAALTGPNAATTVSQDDIVYRNYKDENDLDIIEALVAPYLSEPYSVYCYRYFLHGWPQLCFLAHHGNLPVGVIVCKQDLHRGKLIRGYIAMLSTHPAYRKLGIATKLVEMAIKTMKQEGAQELVLETEASNKGALSLYERLGFIRLKRLHRFYLNSSDAFRLVLPVTEEEWQPPPPGIYEAYQRPRRNTPAELQAQFDKMESDDEWSDDDEGTSGSSVRRHEVHEYSSMYG